MISLGQKIDAFEVPVCNIFRAKVRNDQVCYEMDLNLLKDENDLEDQLQDGITLILDCNEERQFDKDAIKDKKIRNYFYDAKDSSVQVHLDSISNKYNTKKLHDEYVCLLCLLTTLRHKQDKVF